MTITTSKEIHLNHFIQGRPKLSDFKLVEVDIPKPTHNQLLIRNTWMSVDPYMRGRMINRQSYIPPFELNKALTGLCIGIIEASNNSNYQAGDIVTSMNGWREYFISNGEDLTLVEKPNANLQKHLGVLGMTGLTAYYGLMDIGKLKKGDTVFVSAASGAVGSIVCQIAKIYDCKIIGSVGSDQKTKWLSDEVGIDAAFNYKKTKSIDAELSKVCPQGIDVYFENVGGEHLQAAINHMNNFGRIVMCGMISQYNKETPEPGPNNLMQIIAKRLKLQGFIVFDAQNQYPQILDKLANWIDSGQIKVIETIVNGIENAPNAFIDLFSGKNMGKMLVKLCDE